jgi:hypothetical protein
MTYPHRQVLPNTMLCCTVPALWTAYSRFSALQEALSLCPPATELIYVGKRGGGKSSWKQADINALLVELCKQVV